jgi:hypothetical protein
MGKTFNGSAITFNPDVTATTAAALGVLEGLDDEHGAPEVRVTGADGSEHQYDTGREDIGLMVSLLGVPFDYDDDTTRPAAGHTGAIDATWNDGTGPDPDLADAVIQRIEVSGEEDAAITSSIMLLPTAA